MKHIICLRRDDDKFPEVGMTDRTIVQGSLVHAMRYAARWSKDRMSDARIETWPDDQFYTHEPTSVRYYDWNTGFFTTSDPRRQKVA